MLSVKVFDAPMKVKFIILLPIALLWTVGTWLGIVWHPEGGFWQAVLMGLLTLLLLMLADVGHVIAHTFSARLAGAPFDNLSNDNHPNVSFHKSQERSKISFATGRKIIFYVPRDTSAIRAKNTRKGRIIQAYQSFTNCGCVPL